MMQKEGAHGLPRRHLKKRIWAQGQGGTKFPRKAGLPIRSNSSRGSQSTDILKYFEDLKRGTNAEIGFKDFFEIASIRIFMVLLLGSVLFTVYGCDLPDHKPLYRQKQLPYQASALEPTISKRTVELHYGKHYAAYINKANQLVKKSRFKGLSLEQIIQQIPRENEYAEIFNNVAQAWNHEFFFEGLKAQGGGVPQGVLLEQIEMEFQSYDEFKAQFLSAAQSRFGSGWVWLVLTDDQLKIVTTSNADTPLAHGMHPLFTIDLWEHAYYLDYENRRIEYVEALIDNLVDWEVVANRWDQIPAMRDTEIKE